MEIGRRLGGSVPWEVVDAKFVRGRKPVFGWGDHLARCVVLVMQFVITILSGLSARVGDVVAHLGKNKVQ
jgi:hypothetical protein